jgi:hypothetical protein
LGIGTSNRLGKLSEQQRQEVNKQLWSYFQNMDVGMTKQQYFEMCEALGSQPLESEIPVEYEDLVLEVQEALQLYNCLQDSWDYMGGNYIGKNFTGFEYILDLYEVLPGYRKCMYELILQIDEIRAKQIQDKKPKN